MEQMQIGNRGVETPGGSGICLSLIRISESESTYSEIKSFDPFFLFHYYFMSKAFTCAFQFLLGCSV